MIRKAFRLNDFGSIGISIPAKLARDIGLTKEDNVSIILVGQTLHITKVKID
jgi:antitoxin component of MazEF toxin-antitoxin module